MQKLSEKKVEKLIYLIKLKPGLYDKNNVWYKHHEWRDKAWKEIAERMNVDEKDCKTAWKSLRDQFIKSLKDKRKYKYYVNLLFLNDSFGASGPTSNSDIEQDAKEYPHLTENSQYSLFSDVDPLMTGELDRTNGSQLNETQKSLQDVFKSLLTELPSQLNGRNLDGVDSFFLSLSSTVKSYNLSVSDLARFQCTLMTFAVDELEKLKDKTV